MDVLRITGFIEGISFILLLGFAMPLKYIFDMPIYVTIIGAAHGFLFLLYIALLAFATYKFKWSFLRFLGGCIAAVTPFGPFVFDAKLKKKHELELANTTNERL